MVLSVRRLRTPRERVGTLSDGSLPPPNPPAEDRLLLRALADGDEAAFARVIDRYFPAMLRLARAHVATRASAEEVIQETWLAALRGIGRFEGRSSVKTWLFCILRNQARTRGRREARMRAFSELEPAVDSPFMEGAAPGGPASGPAGDPEQQLLSRELAARIELALAQLPPRQREVLVMRDVEGWTPAEVCDALDLSRENQRVLLHRARARVRHDLHGYLAANDGCRDEESTELS